MITVLFIAAGGALGAVSRYAISLVVVAMLGAYWQPLATLMVNVVGSGLMGLAYGMISAGMLYLSEPLRGMILIGFLGALTTFSSFSLDIAVMIDRGQVSMAGFYLIGSVLLSVAAFAMAAGAVRLMAGGQ
ncbi:CrcB family protein [Alphaproteobacteria bacterium LSUCC0684]